MTQWYYADAQRERQGPVDTETLRARLSQGIIDRSSLVWREGLTQWVVLSDVATELGVDQAVPTAPESSAYAPVEAPISEPQMTAGTANADALSANALPTEATPVAAAPLADTAAPGLAEPAVADHHSAVDQQQQLPPGADVPLAEAASWSTTPADPAVTPAAVTAPQTSPPDPTPTPAYASPAPAVGALPSAWDTPNAAAPASAVGLHDAPVVYAGLWRRVAASILDSLITTFAVYLIVIPLVFVIAFASNLSKASTALDDGSAAGIAILVLSYGIGLAIPTLYFAWMQSSRHQASLGKLACGIKLVRADTHGGRVGFWRNVLRYLAYMLISVLTLGIGVIVAAFMAGMSQRKQAPHDKLCETLVVDRWAFTDHPERQSKGLDTVSIVVLAIYAVLVVLSVVVVAFMLAAIGMSQN